MKKILTVILAAVFVFQAGIFPVFAETADEIKNEEQTLPKEWVISGDDIEIQGGIYSYKLVIRANGTLSFDNDLEISYQGIEGCYQLNYEIEENGNHIMIVTGYFENIIVNSPLIEKISDKEMILSHISGDTYSYQLILRTEEGFTFNNDLKFFFDSDPYEYSVNFTYDLSTDNLTVIIDDISDEDQLDEEIQ